MLSIVIVVIAVIIIVASKYFKGKSITINVGDKDNASGKMNQMDEMDPMDQTSQMEQIIGQLGQSDQIKNMLDSMSENGHAFNTETVTTKGNSKTVTNATYVTSGEFTPEEAEEFEQFKKQMKSMPKTEREFRKNSFSFHKSSGGSKNSANQNQAFNNMNTASRSSAFDDMNAASRKSGTSSGKSSKSPFEG
jgi:hypothetical protein